MKSRLLLTGLAAVVVSACGGGGGDSTPAPTVTTKVSGTAATGAAMGNVTVQAKCASGSGSATTAADGTFTINIPDAKRPCVLSATAADGTVLHSIVEAGSDASVTANITPLTELITAALAQGSTKTFFDQFDAGAQARLTPANLTTAQSNVRLALAGTVELLGFDPLKDQLVAATNGSAGNAMDRLLDKLADRLAASKTSLAELAAAIGNNAGAAAIQTVLQTASQTCGGMRNGSYLLIGQNGLQQSFFDASASVLSMKNAQGAVVGQVGFTAVPEQNCRFTVSANGTLSDVAVSSSGIALVHSPSAQSLPSMIVPMQSLELSDLAGKWNALGFERDDATAPYKPTRVTFTLGTDGKLTAGADCTGVNTCTNWPVSDLPVVTANSAGGFLMTDTGGSSYVAAFKGTDGQVSAVIAYADGIVIATKEVARPLPVVGTRNSFWDYTFFGNLSFQGTIATTEIKTVDAQAGTYTRDRTEAGSQTVRKDSWKQNSPANGLRYRAASQDSTARESIAMLLGNTGVGVVISLDATSLFYDISVNRP